MTARNAEVSAQARLFNMPVSLAPHRPVGKQHRRLHALRCWAIGLAACIVLPAHAQPRNAPLPGDYRVIDGRVDRGTYTGWRLFHSACYGCHGVGGGGTDLAPNLVERIQTMTPRAFAARVLTSYRLVSPGESGALDDREREERLDELMRRERGSPRSRVLMPAWDSDDAVPAHVLDLYAYLSARADGALGPGKPKPPLATRR